MNKKNNKKNLLKTLRKKVDRIDDNLIYLIGKRQNLIREIGRYKKVNGLKIVSTYREKSILNKQVNYALNKNIDVRLVKGIYNLIFKHSRKIQRRI